VFLALMPRLYVGTMPPSLNGAIRVSEVWKPN